MWTSLSGQRTSPTSPRSGSLGDALKIVRLTPNGLNDPNVLMQAHNASSAASNSVRTISQGFTIDKQDHTEIEVQNLLEAPITDAEGQLTSGPKAAANGAGKAFCEQFLPLQAKYPFNPAASRKRRWTKSTRFSLPTKLCGRCTTRP